MTSQQILEKYINFYKSNGHKQVPNMSVVPEGDSTLLFVNSGMFPLVPYLSGQPHPLGKRLVNVQRAVRFEDLDDVGDNRHTTAFHMIGNWSLGDYFKQEQLSWIYTVLIEEWGLSPKRLYSSVFEGDKFSPRDTEAIQILKEIYKKYGIEAKEEEKIFAYGRKDNWWQRGDVIGELGGPDSEIYYYIGTDAGFGLGKNPADYQDEFIEIGNSVFMQYKKTKNGWEELPQKNVDFGGGLERSAMVVQGKRDIFETDMFWPVIEKIQELSGKTYGVNENETRSMRILADHVRSSIFLTMDGVTPSNKDRGYVLRRALRRMIRAGRILGVEKNMSVSLVGVACDMLLWLYPDLSEKKKQILEVFAEEENKFALTLEKSYKEVQKVLQDSKNSKSVDPKVFAKLAFDLYQSLGYPLEIFLEDVKDADLKINEKEISEQFEKMYKEHKSESREGAEQKFKGGLADNSEQVIKYHTATHLLNASLKQILGEHIVQMGSNITGERLRFDFPNSTKLTQEQIKSVGDLVNKKIQEKLPVNFVDLPKEQAEKTDAIHAFSEKYGDVARVYYIGDSLDKAFSKEFCGGPHIKNTSEIGPITIYKQEGIGKGIQRIYAKSQK